ncbi:MAG: serine protease, partial [Verrucomicrobia bacterium]|nr:serine protease [Verrucomicrobiota bacterium]
MIRAILSIILALAFPAGPLLAIAPQDEPVVKAVEKVRPAVVNIFTERIVTQEVRDPRDVFFE